MASIVVTWWIVDFLRSDSICGMMVSASYVHKDHTGSRPISVSSLGSSFQICFRSNEEWAYLTHDLLGKVRPISRCHDV